MIHPEYHTDLVDLGGINTQIRCRVEGAGPIHAHERLQGALGLLDQPVHAILGMVFVPW